ncbi:hypothetical protein [Lacibacter sediminis]|uniref:Uncharacterized protein n=1 Tax=Lacibacter sediminis TaxID=2760713 RepID=A0A7G5XCJ2_9BACT|nr:hypothetical protein [Lacibacter sediminis]QNA43195.1 hypothetical protein H4075_14025 [Lacibacter sediminis]
MGRFRRFLWQRIGWIVSGLSIVFIVVPVIVYRLNFGGFMSDSKGDFGTFGDFMNPFLSLTSIILLGYISLQTFITSRNYNEIQLRPHLFLEEVSSSMANHSFVWQLTLVSEAPAVNVFVRFNLGGANFTKWVLCPPFSKNKTPLVLTWIRSAPSIELMYSDITGQNIYGIRLANRLHQPFSPNRELFNLEVNRVRIPSDFHIDLDLSYRSMFVVPGNPPPYPTFVQRNLV